MVVTSLIYFDNPVNSGIYGTLRGLVSFPIILLFGIPFLCLCRGAAVHKIWSLILLSLALCSAIGVQLPKGYGECILYAGLIGLVVSVGFICIRTLFDGYADSIEASEKENKRDHLIWLSIPYLCVCLIVSAVCTHAVSKRFDLYRPKL